MYAERNVHVIQCSHAATDRLILGRSTYVRIVVTEDLLACAWYVRLYICWSHMPLYLLCITCMTIPRCWHSASFLEHASVHAPHACIHCVASHAACLPAACSAFVVRIHTHTQAHIHACTQTHTHIHGWTHKCRHTCQHTHTHIYVINFYFLRCLAWTSRTLAYYITSDACALS